MSTCPGKDIATLSKVADRVRRHIWKTEDNSIEPKIWIGKYLKKIQMFFIRFYCENLFEEALIKWLPSCNFYRSMENLTSTILPQTQKNVSDVVQDESVSKNPQTPFLGSIYLQFSLVSYDSHLNALFFEMRFLFRKNSHFYLIEIKAGIVCENFR